MSDSKYTIIAGLGNPGRKYAQTRHNIGFLVVDSLAQEANASLDKTRFDSQYVKVRVGGRDIFLLKPQSYMNRSGIPIRQFASYYKVTMDNLIVVHDDMDLSFGQAKIVKNRGHGGHNGVRSIIGEFGSRDFIRVRAGVGHPGVAREVTGHVLGRFAPDEQKQLGHVVENSKNACLSILKNGATAAMNLFNTRS